MANTSMLSRINVRADGKTGEIDIGFLAECLLYYETVNVLGSEGDLNSLIRAATANGLEQLFRIGALRFLLHPASTAVLTQDLGSGTERHDFAFFSKVDQETKKSIPLSRVVTESVDDASRANKWIASRFVQNSRLPTIDLVAARKQLWESGMLRSLLVHWLKNVLPDDPHFHADIRLTSWELARALQISTSVDFDDVTDALRRAYGPSDRFEGLNIAHFLGYALDAYVDMHYAANTNADIAKTAFGSPILEQLALHSLRAMEARVAEIHDFQHHILNDTYAISEAINSGEKSLEEFVPIIEKSRLFKKWLAQKDPDVSLISAYVADVTKDTWAEKLPVKAVRWGIFTSASKLTEILGGSGIVVEAIDALVVDKLLKGWRPNQFIDQRLKKFLEGSQ